MAKRKVVEKSGKGRMICHTCRRTDWKSKLVGPARDMVEKGEVEVDCPKCRITPTGTSVILRRSPFS